MATARLVMTMAVLGAAGGAALALTLMPGFTPYAERETRAPITFQKPVSDAEAYGYAPARREKEREDFTVDLGGERGSVVIEMPRWAGETAAWAAYGHRTFEDWSNWAQDMEQRAQALAGGHPRDEDEDGSGYARPEYARPQHDRLEYDAPGREEPDAAPRTWQDEVAPAYDAAAQAAQQAREAARDARAAQGW